MMKRTEPKDPAASAEYRKLWRLVDGAVADTFAMHPDYLSKRGARLARRSINKRVVGTILGYATQVAQGRPGLSPAADEDSALSSSSGGLVWVRRWRSALCKGASAILTRGARR